MDTTPPPPPPSDPTGYTPHPLPPAPEIPPGSTPPPPGTPDKDQRLWATLAHLGGLAGLFFPPGNVIIPLVIWLMKRDGAPFVDDQAKEAVNFHITTLLALVVAGILAYACIGFILLPVVWVGAVILGIIALMKANEGVAYRYPLALRLVQ